MMIKKTNRLFWVVFCSIALSACSIPKKIPTSAVRGTDIVNSSSQPVLNGDHKEHKNTIATKFSPLTDLGIKLVDSNVVDKLGSRYLHSELEIINATTYRTKLFIAGWMLDDRYKRYPLFVEISKKSGKKIVEIEIPSRSSVNIVYIAASDPTFTLGKYSLGMLELKDQGGVKMNLTIPR